MAIQRDKITASAEKLVAKGKIEAAIREYERLIEENPGDVNTLNRIGDLWSRINRNDEAVKVFTRIADHYSRDGFFLKAIAIYKKINKLDPSKLDIYGKLAELYARQGLSMEAKSQYQVLADYYMKHGDPANALATYRRILELDPNSINISVKLADLYSQTGQTAQALEQYEKVGKALLRRGMSDEAAQVFRKAVRIAPDNADIAESAVGILTEAGDTKGAAEILSSALEKAPGNPRLVARLGRLHLQSGDAAEARRVLQEGLQSNPDDFSIRAGLADLRVDEGDSDAAWRLLQPALDSALTGADAPAAAETLEKIAARDPDHTEVLSSLAKAYQQSGQTAQWGSAMTRLSLAHEHRGDSGQALRIAQELSSRDPGNATYGARVRELRERTAGAPAPMTSEPAAEEELSLEFGSGPDLDMALDEPSFDMSPPDTSAAPTIPSDPDEDIDFVTAHMTEAEVFGKYGLIDKAVEHLTMITARYPSNRTARQALMRLWMEEGRVAELERAAREYAAILSRQNDRAAISGLKDELIASGYEQISAAIATTETPPLPAEPGPGGELLPAIDFAEEEQIEFDMDSTSAEISSGAEEVPEIEVDFPDTTIDLDVPPAEPIETIETPLADDLEISFDTGGEEPAAEEMTLEPEPSPAPLEEEAPPEIELGEFEPQIEEEPPQQPEVLIPEPQQPEPSLSFGEGAADQTWPQAGAPAAEELGEIDFYLEQELFSEAEQHLDELELRWPGAPGLLERRAKLDAARSASETAPTEMPSLDIESELMGAIPEGDAVAETASAGASLDESGLFADEDDFFDLAAELENELQDDDLIPMAEEEQSLEDIFREFKKGVEQQLDSEDYETHYNLGIAYKEMGLIDEAISEFQLASKDPKRTIECCSMLGICFLEKGMPQLAVKWYQKGLEAPEITEDEQLGLMYDLGAAYLEIGDVPSAQKAFVDIYGVNSNYRDVADRIRDLEDVNR